MVEPQTTTEPQIDKETTMTPPSSTVPGRGRALRAGLASLFAALALAALVPAGASAAFGIASFDGAVVDQGGHAATQAGSHPAAASTTVSLNTTTGAFGVTIPDESVKDLLVDLPAGFVGNPNAVPTCSESELAGVGSEARCPHNTQVGFATIHEGGFSSQEVFVPVFSMVAPPGSPAAFGFNFAGVLVHLTARLRSGEDSGVGIDARNINQALALDGTEVTFWGMPASPVHTEQRCWQYAYYTSSPVCPGGGPEEADTPQPAGIAVKAFLTNPTSCTAPGVGLPTRLRAVSWAGAFDEATFISHEVGEPTVQVGPSGCDRVPFEPSFALRPTAGEAAAPTGLSVTLGIPSGGLENPDGLAQADLRKAVVTLPSGMTVNPAAATGLGACTAAQIGLLGTNFAAPNPIHFTPDPATCPASAKVGSAEVRTPLLEEPLQGAIYLAQQKENPFGSLLAVYLVLENSERGVVLKLPGQVTADPETGQLTATFDDNPQLPFETMKLSFFGGPRAALVNPPSCGNYETTAELSPWSGNPPVTLTSSFQVSAGPGGGPCPNGGFDPKFSAGTTNPVAGAYSPLTIRVGREDGDQLLKGISVSLPEGLVGKLAGIPYCPDAALAGIAAAEGAAAAQVQSPSCPAASQVGTVTVGAGAGPDPFYLQTGKAYLAGPYKGAPLSLAIVTPALAGPFDLGNVVVRSALQVDPETAQITAVSDPLPTILHGIPLDLRDVRVEISREGFTLNPTSCEPMQVKGTISPSQGAGAAVSDRFQVASCERLGFKPRLNLSLKGSTQRTGHPALKAVVTMPPGANIARAQVGLPGSEFLDQGNLDKVCTRPALLAGNCPASSVYGKVRAWTPLLEKPLEGNVYLVGGYGYKLPALVADLNGQVRILLVGRIDTTRRHGIRNTFTVVPDAPVSRFVLEMKGGKKYGLLENSEGICRKVRRAAARFVAHNGKVAQLNPRLQAGCGGGGHRATEGKAGR